VGIITVVLLAISRIESADQASHSRSSHLFLVVASRMQKF